MTVTLPIDGVSNTLSYIIENALLEIQAIAIGETIEDGVTDLCVYRFNTLLASYVNDIVPLQARDTLSLTFIDGTEEYATPSHTTRVLSIGDSNYNVINAEDYTTLLAGPNSGLPYVFVDYGSSPPILKFINQGDAGTTLTYRRERSPVALTSTDTPEYPIEATEMLILGLAHKIARGFGVPAQQRAELKQDYEMERRDYLFKQTQREGDEIVQPPFIV